jgi:hypothetical protein
MIAKPHEVGLVDSRRADSLSLSMAQARNYPMCENTLARDCDSINVSQRALIVARSVAGRSYFGRLRKILLRLCDGGIAGSHLNTIAREEPYRATPYFGDEPEAVPLGFVHPVPAIERLIDKCGKHRLVFFFHALSLMLTFMGARRCGLMCLAVA